MLKADYKKFSELTPEAAPDGTELVPIVKDPSGTPSNAVVTLQKIWDLSPAGLTGAEIVALIDAEIGNSDWQTQVTAEQIQDIVAAMFAAGTHTNVTVTYDDNTGSLSISASGGGATVTDEEIQDVVGAFVVAGTGVTATYNDAANTLTFSLSDEVFTAAYRAKLDGIEAGARADQVASEVPVDDSAFQVLAQTDAQSVFEEIDAALDGKSSVGHSHTASDVTDFDTEVSNNTAVAANTAARHTHANQTVLDNTTASFTSADETKLDGVESGATADQTAAEIKAAYESNADTNEFSDSEKSKVANISISQPVDLDAIEARVNDLDAAVILRGAWDASVGSFPGSGSAQAGDSYIVSVSGTVDGISFSAGDRLIAILDNASTSTYASNWLKLDYSDLVSSVAGKTGAVVLDSDDVDESTTRKYVTANEKIKYVQLTVFDYTTDVAAGDGGAYLHIPTGLNGMNLVEVHAEVITAGTTGTLDIQIANVTQAADMLTTKLTIDSGETGSDTAATAASIDSANDDVATNDLLRIDVDAVQTTAPKGLLVTLGFALP